MDTEQLEIFNQVVEQGSFSAVAKQRSVNVSSISRNIQALEAELDFSLFKRTTRQLNLTEAGQAYWLAMKPHLQGLGLAKQAAQDLKQHLKGTLKITLPSEFAEQQVIPLVPSFKKQHPDLSLEILITDECLDFEQQNIDVGIRLGDVQEATWVARPLKKIRFLLVATSKFLAEHSVKSPQDCATYPCLAFYDGPKMSQWFFKPNAPTHDANSFGNSQNFQGSQLKAGQIDIQNSQLITSTRAVRDLCLLDQGLAVLPDWLVEENIQSGQLVSVLPEWQVSITEQPGKVFCVYPNRDYVPAKTRAFVDFMVTHLGKG